MELKKHIPFIVIVLAILGTWNSTRLEFVDLRTEMRAELGTLSERITVLDERVSTLCERVARIVRCPVRQGVEPLPARAADRRRIAISRI